MTLLAVLVTLFLPLHGITNAFGSIQSPAHYHRLLPTQLTKPGLQVPELGTQVLAILDSETAAARREGFSDTRHGHALDQAGVVYMGDDADAGDNGLGGKHVSTTGEAALLAWVMPVFQRQNGLVLPDPGDAMFCSHASPPPLRPPCVSGHFAA